MQKRILSCFIALFFSVVLIAQNSFPSSYEFVDSVSISTGSGEVRLWIGYCKQEPIGSSLIVYKKGDQIELIKNLLQPYKLKERGMGGYTYGGFTVRGTTVAFCQIDAFHVDTLYVDFSEHEPTFLKLVRRGYKKEFENFQIVARKKITIKDYLGFNEREKEHATKIKRIKWESPLGTRMADYTLNGHWLPNYVISDTVSLGSDKRVFIGFDKRDWCSVLLFENTGRIANYRHIFYVNINAEESSGEYLGIRPCVLFDDIVSFVQRYDNCIDSIFINFSKDVPYYHRIIHTCNDSNRKEVVQITPKEKVFINEARTLNGDVFVFPSEKKNKMFNFRYSSMK
jgi:hypothetical protein